MRSTEDKSLRIAASALGAALAACMLYALELALRPYALALASGETIPYFSRLMRGAGLAVLVFALSLLLPHAWAGRFLRAAAWVTGAVVGLVVLVALLFP